MSTSIKVSGDALPWAMRMQAAMDSPRLLKAMASEGAKTVRGNFRDLARMRHGGGPHNYYAAAARATSWVVRGNRDAFIIVDHVGINQRFHGGTIRARRGALTIPVKGSAAEGKRASEFDDIFSVNRDTENKGFLARLDAAGELEPLFWLRKSVYQYPDPSVLPSDQELMDSMGKALEREIDRI
ncbi:MAG: hypothetical protein OES84_05580 [Kiritimatiellaceae bacterium]|nr:hypothetical protein [Kiritimatiellaceae bacterium]